MILGVYAKAFAGSTRAQIAAAGAAGFEGLELRGDVDSMPLTQLPLAEFRELCIAAAEVGLSITTLALGTMQGLVGELDGLKRVGELAAVAGARVRLFSSARPDRSNPELFLEEPEPDWLEAEAIRLRTCAHTIRETGGGVLVMLEAEPYSIANTIARQAALIEVAGVPEVGFNWDFVNCWRGGEYPWPETWEQLSGKLYGVHMKGACARCRAPQLYASQAVPLLDDLPHLAIWTTLAGTGFDGPITVDPHYQDFAEGDRFEPEPDNPNAELCLRTLTVMQELRDRAFARL